MKRAAIVLYLAALGFSLLLAVLAWLVLAVRIWSPGPSPSTLENLLFGLYFVGGGFATWMSLAYLYRRVMPLHCPNCGRATRAISLNPVTTSCKRCGRKHTFGFHLLGTGPSTNEQREGEK